MLTASTRKAAYSIVLLGILTLAVLTAMGSIRGASAQESSSNDESDICEGIGHAQAALQEASALEGIGTSTLEHLLALREALTQVSGLEQNGEIHKALALKIGILKRIRFAAGVASEEGNTALSEILEAAAEFLEECAERPTGDTPPGGGEDPTTTPHPRARLAYASKFLCGRVVDRERMKTEKLGNQSFLYKEQEYRTEVNIHNLGPEPVTFWLRATKAEPLGAKQGRISRRVKRTLRPHHSVQVDCKNIKRMLGKVQHKVCDGKQEAQATLREIAGLLSDASTDSASTSPALTSKAVERMIKALDKAIQLEKSGELRKAFKVERQIAETLDKMVRRAENQGLETLAMRLSEARDLVHRCIGVLMHDLEPLSDSSDVNRKKGVGRDKVLDGFLTLESPSRVEVTAVYRSTANSAGFGGGVGAGIDVEVVQVRPHRIGPQESTGIEAEQENG